MFTAKTSDSNTKFNGFPVCNHFKNSRQNIMSIVIGSVRFKYVKHT